MRRILGLILIIIAIIVIVWGVTRNNNNSSNQTSSGPGTSSQQTNQNNSSSPRAGTINIRNMMFTPSQITIAKGGTVTWTNNDTTTHTVVDDLANAGGPNSGDIAPGQSYSFTFTKTGSLQYHCSIHPSMRGTIVVK